MTAQRQAQAAGMARPRPLLSVLTESDLTAIDLALDAMGVGVFECDLVSGEHQFSERCKRIWGFAAEDDPTPEMILSRVHPDDRHLAANIWEAAYPEGSGRYSIEHRIVLPDGSTRWVLVSGRTIFSESCGARRALRGYGAMQDITERKAAEQQLYERTSQLRTFVEGVPVSIAIFNRDMRFIAYSQRYAEERELVGVDLIGRSAYELLPNMPEHWRAAHLRALNGETERNEQDLYVRQDGRREWVRWEVRPWYKADSEVGGIILFAEFITHRIQAQEQLRESQAGLELAIRASALGIYDYDMISGRLDWDSRLRELWGIGQDEEVTPEMFRRALHPEDREAVDRAVIEILDAGVDRVLAHEYRIVNRADGSIRWIASTGRVYRDGQGSMRLVGVAEDITERKRTELALEQSAEELRRADECKNLFLATLSHELRNPLAPIRTAAHLLASPKLTAEKLRWVSQVVGRQTGHMASLLEDLLEVTRISRGTLILRKEHMLFSGIAQSAIESARPLIDQKHHRLLVSLPGDSLAVYADPVRLSQVLSNLLSNAAKYTDSGGQIELTAKLEEEVLVIRVKDSGIGIPRESLSKIFTMFWQGDGHSQGGLGIGLAFVQGVVQSHGGTIEARSEGPSRGSEFIVRLPVETTSVLAPAAASAEARSSGRHRVLIADDDKDTADTLEMALTFADHEVRVAYTGQEALSVARDFKPDLALLDLGMPGMDGYCLARELRRQPWASNLRLIALTGRGQPEDQRRAGEAGFDQQLIKPIDPERLRRLL
jgi:PAS domain S-box-containing protein